MTPSTVQEFLTAKAAAGRTKKTVGFYEHQLEMFVRWLAADMPDADILDAQPVDLERYLVAQQERGLAPHSVNAGFRALSAFFRWAWRRYDLPGLPVIGKVEKPAVPTRRPKYVTRDEYRQLLGTIELATWIDHRDYGIVETLYWAGLRRTECANLHIDDLNFEDGLIYVRSGKGSKDRYVPLAPTVQSAVLSYLTHRPKWAGPELWVGSRRTWPGRPLCALTSDGIRLMLARRCQQAGLRTLSAHAWRHGFAMMMLNQGMAPIGLISVVMGHTSTAITEQVYARWLTDGITRGYADALARLGKIEA